MGQRSSYSRSWTTLGVNLLSATESPCALVLLPPSLASGYPVTSLPARHGPPYHGDEK